MPLLPSHNHSGERRMTAIHRYEGGTVKRLEMGPYTFEYGELEHEWFLAYFNMESESYPQNARVFYYPTVDEGTPRKMKAVEKPLFSTDLVQQGYFGPVPVFLDHDPPLGI